MCRSQSLLPLTIIHCATMAAVLLSPWSPSATPIEGSIFRWCCVLIPDPNFSPSLLYATALLHRESWHRSNQQSSDPPSPTTLTPPPSTTTEHCCLRIEKWRTYTWKASQSMASISSIHRTISLDNSLLWLSISTTQTTFCPLHTLFPCYMKHRWWYSFLSLSLSFFLSLLSDSLQL